MAKLKQQSIQIKVLGIGGAGVNILNFLAADPFSSSVELAAIDTDIQSISLSTVPEQSILGHSLTRGLSTGGDLEIGRKVAAEEIENIHKIVDSVNFLIIIMGSGGGTGSSIAPVVAKEARKRGSLVLCFACLPFTLEGKRKYQISEFALSELRAQAAAVIPVPNDLLLQELEPSESILTAFEKGSQWITRGIQALVAIVTKIGLINLDFATLCALFELQGSKTLYGLGSAQGDNYVKKALDNLTICPLLHTPQQTRTADRLLINIIGGRNLSLGDINFLLATITERFCSKEETQLGAVIDNSKKDYVEICILGTTQVRSGKKSPKAVIQEIDMSEASMAYTEIAFLEDHNSSARDYFDATEQNLCEGEDLDVPTYLRRGIKIRF